MAGMLDNDRCKTSPIPGQAGVAGGTGADGATVQRVTLATDVSLPAGTNLLGQVNSQPATSGGCSVSRAIDLSIANQGSTVAKASAGQVFGVLVTNTNAAVRYLKIYNKATGPTSADTPIMTIAIPAATTGAGLTLTFPLGVACSAGISYRATTGVADNDANAVAASEIIVNVFYK